MTEQDKEEVRKIVREELQKHPFVIPAGATINFATAQPAPAYASAGNAVPANCVCHSDTQRSICNYGCLQASAAKATFKVSYNPNFLNNDQNT